MNWPIFYCSDFVYINYSSFLTIFVFHYFKFVLIFVFSCFGSLPNNFYDYFKHLEILPNDCTFFSVIHYNLYFCLCIGVYVVYYYVLLSYWLKYNFNYWFYLYKDLFILSEFNWVILCPSNLVRHGKSFLIYLLTFRRFFMEVLWLPWFRLSLMVLVIIFLKKFHIFNLTCIWDFEEDTSRYKRK